MQISMTSLLETALLPGYIATVALDCKMLELHHKMSQNNSLKQL
jgi:hypothetical protein